MGQIITDVVFIFLLITMAVSITTATWLMLDRTMRGRDDG